MKFRILRSILLPELGLLRGVVEKKSTIPVLAQLRVDARSDGTVTLTGTDLDVTLLTTSDASVDAPGTALVPASRLFDIVRSLPDEEITFTRNGRNLQITCGGSEFKLPSDDTESFPTTPAWTEQSVQIPAKTLSSVIGRTAFAITQEESRYALNGGLFQIENAKLTMVTTDGHRLALASSNGLPADGAQIREIVPKKALAQITQLVAALGKDAETVGFATDKTHLFFDFGRRRLISRMMAGQFPNYEIILPKHNERIISLATQEFSQAIKRAALMADERSHGIKLELTGSTLSLSAQSADVGESKESLSVEYAGDVMSIGFNAQYLLDFLTTVGSERVTLALKDEQSPALFTPEDGSDYRYVAMPMRLL